MRSKDKVNIKLLSVIVPAYKQEKTIKKDILHIKDTLSALDIPYEIIVVVDGFQDKTYETVKKLRLRNIRVIGYKKNYGKGFAVRAGMKNAKGEIIAFLDAGMDINPKSIEMLLTIMKKKHADIVIGSKLHKLSKVTYPWQRRVFSWGYQTFVHILFGLSVRDTQVGIKLFRRDIITALLPRLLVKRYAFDIELLAVSHYLGYKKIYEAPIILKFNNWSSVTSKNFWQVILHMLWDTCAVYYRLKILHYYDGKNKASWKNKELAF